MTKTTPSSNSNAVPSLTTSSIQQHVDEEKYKKIKRKLKETMELNDSLSKNFIRAKKKIRTLTFERNLLLDNIARMSHYHQSISSDELCFTSVSETDSSETEAPFTNHNNGKSITTRVPRRVMSNHHATTDDQQQQQQQKVTTVASAPPKRSKVNRINLKTRRVQPIDRDEQGNPILPQQIGVLTVISLGRIITDRDTFHNERYIFPIGYTVRRTYPSMIDPDSNTVITSTIIDGEDGPRFHVVAADQPDHPIVANSATGAWTVVVRKSNEIRHREHSNSASGPDYYGFKHPTIAKMIQDLPGTRNLRNYLWQDFEEMEPRAAKGVMAAAEKKRDNLEQMGNANRKTAVVPSVVVNGRNMASTETVEDKKSTDGNSRYGSMTDDTSFHHLDITENVNNNASVITSPSNAYNTIMEADEEIDELGASDNEQ
ncbi:MAG: F/Y-rich N-terminus-domain-containing protein [Benjaminiella poitrasii]|nr:MAG: F/Y-rich N-terminus-domain-containing protein [Benjaminiella poitrasii]